MPESNNTGGRKPRVSDGDLLDVFRDTTDPVLSTAEVAEHVPIKRRGVLNRLRGLEDAGELESKQIGGRNTVWWVDAENDTPNMSDGHPTGSGDVTHDTAAEDAARADAEGGTSKPPGDTSANTHGEEDALAAVLPALPSTVDPDAALETILAAQEYLTKHQTATKTDFVRGVMRDHPLGYDPDAALAKIEAGDRYRGAWWRKVVKPGLEALPDVRKPPRGGSDWKIAEGDT